MSTHVPAERPRVRFSLRTVLWVMVLVAIASAILYYAQFARIEARRLSEINNFKQVGLALVNYYQTRDSFPPAQLTDTSGKPFESWRVMIVPFLEATILHTAYDHQKSWDSPANNALCHTYGRWYVSLQGNATGQPITNIVMPVGPGTIGEQATSLKDITDNTAETIMILGLCPSDILWHEPRDLSLSEITRASGNPRRILIRGRLFEGAFCAFVDGSVHWLPADLDYDNFLAMLTIAGGEKVDLSWQTTVSR